MTTATRTAPFARVSETSRAAAESITDHKRATEQRRVLLALHEAGSAGLTRQELEDATGLPGDSLRPRCWELLGNDGFPHYIEDCGTRPTRSGRMAEVLVLTRSGQRVMAEVS